MSTSPRFWNKLADKYARRPIDDEAAYKHKLEKTQEFFRPDMIVLEFACGTGGTALRHAPFVAEITAIDYSENMIAIARSKAEAAGVTNVRFAVESIQDHAAPDATYDVVMGMSILHLLPDRAEMLEKVHRLLKPGGLFVSSTICLGNMNPVFRLALPIMRFFGKAPFVDTFTADRLAGQIEAAGFAIEHRWQPKPAAAVFIIARKH